MTDNDNGGHNRRAFFRKGFARLLNPFSEWIEEHTDIAAVANDSTRWLRPPGALVVEEFADSCGRCGDCMRICPAKAIVPHPGPDPMLLGTPAIAAAISPCVVCEGLLCTQVCPSGALKPLTLPSEVRMGLAKVDATLCSRTHNEVCTTCVDVCPIGTEALRFIGDGPPLVLDPGCVGCGVCEQQCPTTPKAIIVEPL
jgi:ferredoxin-type protein NapG